MHCVMSLHVSVSVCFCLSLRVTVCLCAYVCVCLSLSLSLCLSLCILRVGVCMLLYRPVFVCMCLCAPVYLCICICVRLYVSACVCACVCAMCVCRCVCARLRDRFAKYESANWGVRSPIDNGQPPKCSIWDSYLCELLLCDSVNWPYLLHVWVCSCLVCVSTRCASVFVGPLNYQCQDLGFWELDSELRLPVGGEITKREERPRQVLPQAISARKLVAHLRTARHLEIAAMVNTAFLDEVSEPRKQYTLYIYIYI